jgi:hypothetical protein
MSTSIAKELAALEPMTIGELHNRYAEVFGEQARSRHKQYLVRRIAWRIQANAEGGLSERALRRAEELADIRDVRVTPPRGTPSPRQGRPAATGRTPLDRRLPAVGTAITRAYRGQTISVTVLADGFEYAGERYRSLTAVAKTITGSHVNGFRFFGLEGKP